MSDQNDTIRLEDVVGVIKRNIVTAALVTATAGAVAVAVAYQIPKRYKATAVLSVPASYYRSPLVSDVVVEESDSNELDAKRQSLLRMALSDQFLDGLADRYDVYSSRPGTPLRATERELFRKRIEYYPVNASNFQISISGERPRAVYEMTEAVLKQMTATLVEDRLRSLLRARDAIEQQVQFIGKILKDTGGSGQAEALREKLAEMDGNLRALRAKFTENHPELAALRQRTESVRQRLKSMPSAPRPAPRAAADEDDLGQYFVSLRRTSAPQDIYRELLGKLTNLNITLGMEKGPDQGSYLSVVEPPSVPNVPNFPDKKLFLLGGLAAGALLSALIGTYRELKRTSAVTPIKASETLGVPFLGELPLLVHRDERLLLEGPVRKVMPALPYTRE